MAGVVEPGKAVLVDRELYREARKLLPRLARDEANIRPLPSICTRHEEAYGLYNRRNNFKKPVISLKEAIVAGLSRLGLIEEVEGSFVISREGIMWLRRQMASAEPFAEQQQLRRQNKQEVGNVLRPVIVNDAESPLAWLRRRKDRKGMPLISDGQYEAGERLRSDFERGQLMPNTTSNWEGLAPSRRQRRSAPGGATDLSDSALAARERVAGALSAVGPELAGILVDVCCHLKGLSETEKGNGWPQRSGKVILQIALSRLARHYGIQVDEAVPDRRGRIAHWGASGYRPSLEKWE